MIFLQGFFPGIAAFFLTVLTLSSFGQSTFAGDQPDNPTTAELSLPWRGPLVQILDLPGVWAGVKALQVTVAVNGQPTGDAGLGAWTSDVHGRWFQVAYGRLGPGIHDLTLDFSKAQPEQHRGPWNPAAAAEMSRGGIFLWSSATAATCPTVRVLRHEIVVHDKKTVNDNNRLVAGILRNVTFPQQVACGERWELSMEPFPYPDNPYANTPFVVTAQVRGPNQESFVLQGFHYEPMRFVDAGDKEIAIPDGSPRFVMRMRPWLPGTWTVAITATWAHSASRPAIIRTLTIPVKSIGPARDDMVRVDSRDPRFLSVGARSGTAAFIWPVGFNLRSVNDKRSVEWGVGTTLTPDRGLLSYAAYLKRFAENAQYARGQAVIEVWLSPWNLGLEWSTGWAGFQGAGRYHQGNAERLDRLLDMAWERGIRVVLVLMNHGQVSPRVDSDFSHHPYHRNNGGWLAGPADYFTDSRSLAMQAQQRRYVVARWADHPGLIGWKLCSEVNLTAGRGEALVEWHRQAGAHLQQLDPYGRFVAPHWSGDFRRPDPLICQLPEMTLLGIDAYGKPRAGNDPALPKTLLDLLLDGLTDTTKGMHLYQKPVWVLEYGGGGQFAPPPVLLAQLQAAPWISAVTGYAASPLLWWYEFIDQNNYYAETTRISAFLQGEDLRGADARSIVLNTDRDRLAIIWSRPGHILGWIGDRPWQLAGIPSATRSSAILISQAAAAGPMELTWWDAHTSRPDATQIIHHPGGPLSIQTPPFATHRAFKLRRTPGVRPAP